MPFTCNSAKKLLAASILIILLTIFLRRNEQLNYFIVIDAGSSGSRCHIYSYRNTGLLPGINQINSIKISPGISSLVNQDQIQTYLKDILDFADKQIPEKEQSKTPLFLYATAGMRLLSSSEQKLIIDASCLFFQKSSKFFIPNCENFKVISGKDEGIFGWLTVNYLKKALIPASGGMKGDTFGFLDMGGASSQIAFEPTKDMALKHEEDLIELNLEVSDGSISSFKIFVETFLGFGANEAKRRYLKDKLNHIKSGVIQDNCRLKGHQDLEGGKAVLGTGDYAQCINDLSKLLNKDLPCDDDPCYFNGVHIPTSSFSRFKLVGVSEFWYISTNIYDLGGTYNSTAFLSTFKRICSSNWTDFKENSDIFDDLYSLDPLFVEEQCFKSSWIYTFLHYGLHLKHQKYSQLDSSNVEFLNKIGDMEVSWTLGAVLISICSSANNPLPRYSLRHWYSGMIFLFLGFVVTFFICSFSKIYSNTVSGQPGRRKASDPYMSIV